MNVLASFAVPYERSACPYAARTIVLQVTHTVYGNGVTSTPVDQCEVCALVASNLVGTVGSNVVVLHPDQHYSLRCIVAPMQHAPGPIGLSRSYLDQTQALVFRIGEEINRLEDVRRINYAILGNREQDHFHWHIIPRYMGEQNATKAPWPRRKKILENEQEKVAAIERLRSCLEPLCLVEEAGEGEC